MTRHIEHAGELLAVHVETEAARRSAPGSTTTTGEDMDL
jgi:hypothetical protein